MDMAQVNRLSITKTNNLKKRGFYCDGGGLYLQVAPGGSKSWVFRYKRKDESHPRGFKTRDMGLGSYVTLGLADAREAATNCRRQLLKGIDPLEAKRTGRALIQMEAGKAKTFEQCATAFIEDKGGKWTNPKHRQQWQNTIATTINPIIGALPVSAVDTAAVLKVLRPIWTKTPETASRIRGRIEKILSWAKAHGYRQGDNPALWTGHLDQILSERATSDHFPALPYERIGEFVAHLRTRKGISAIALELTILTANRTGPVINAKWSEIDFAEKVWNIPAENMKNKTRAHRIPLTSRALEILRDLEASKAGEYIFGGRKPISNMAMAELIKGMNAENAKLGRPEYLDPKEGDRPITVHGFRSAFKDWSRERTSFADVLSEIALAHTVKGADSETYAAYARGDMLEKRQRLMDTWASYCAKPVAAADVVSINRAVAK